MELQLTDVVQRVQAGDPAAFSALYEQTQNFVYYTALKMMRDPLDAEDAMQLIYIKVWSGIGSLKDPQSAPKWLKTIVVNTCLNELDRRKRRVTGLDEGEEDMTELPEGETAFLPEEALDREATRDIILRMIDSLPEKQRVTVYLYYFDELSIEEIARQLGISPGTVKSRLNSARLKIRDAVMAEEKRGVKLYAIPLLLFRTLELDAQRFQPSAALAASVLQQAGTAPSAANAGAAASGAGPASGGNTAGATRAAQAAARGGLGTVAKIGIGAAIAALVGGGAALLLLRDGVPAEPPQPPAQTTQTVSGTATPEPDSLPGEPETPESGAEDGEMAAAPLPPIGELTYESAFDDGTGYVHIIVPNAPPELYTLHLAAAPFISEEEAAGIIADWEANAGWGNSWTSNSTFGNENNAYVASLRHPDETGGSPFDLLVVSFDETWHAVSYDILHVAVS